MQQGNKFFLFGVFLLLFQVAYTQSIPNDRVRSFEPYFKQAYRTYPAIPKGVLEAVAYTKTHLRHIQPTREPASCIGLPGYYGVMGLIRDGKGYFKNTLQLIAHHSSFTERAIVRSPQASILAYAEAFVTVRSKLKVKNGGIAAHMPVLKYLSELPDKREGQRFALDASLYNVLTLLRDSSFMEQWGYAPRQINLRKIFGPNNYKVLSASKILMTPTSIKGNNTRYSMQQTCVNPPDYPPAIWDEADPSNYTDNRSCTISAMVIHTIQGTYAGAISWFKNPSSNVSSHYVLRSNDGQVTQMVCEADKGWHVGSENCYTIGFEHEGYVSDSSWYTAAMYQSSAALAANICTRQSISPLRTAYQPWAPTDDYSDGIPPTMGSCVKIKGHRHYPNQTHTDPGQYWDWDYYYRHINKYTTSPDTLTTPTDTIYDSGGSAGNYSNDENMIKVIDPPGNNPVTLTFDYVDIEQSWDYLYVFDGSSVFAPLLKRYTGYHGPDTITSTSGVVTLEFRSDCATTDPGWEVSWSTTGINQVPNGNVDILDCNYVTGWAFDPDSSSKSIDIAIYIDNAFAQQVTTDVYRSDVNNTFGITGDHGFVWEVPSAYKDGSTHNFDVYAINTPSNNNDPRIGGGTMAACSVTAQCAGQFTDTGSDTANYDNNETYSYTIQPNNAQKITATFNSFSVDDDTLYIYEGTSRYDPLIGKYAQQNSPGTIVSDSGALTFYFESNSTNVSWGWTMDWETLYQPPNVTYSPTSTICDNQAAVLTAQGGQSFYWSTGDSTQTINVAPDSTTEYYVYSKRQSCQSDTAFATLQVKPAPRATFVADDTLITVGETVNFTNNTLSASNFSWDFGDGDTSSTLHPAHAYNQTGMYDVTLAARSSNGCSDTLSKEKYIQVEPYTGVEASSSAMQLGVYPNPSYQQPVIYYRLPADSEVKIQLLDVTGRSLATIQNERQRKGTYRISLERPGVNLNSGIYFIRLTTGDGRVTTKWIKL